MAEKKQTKKTEKIVLKQYTCRDTCGKAYLVSGEDYPSAMTTLARQFYDNGLVFPRDIAPNSLREVTK